MCDGLTSGFIASHDASLSTQRREREGFSMLQKTSVIACAISSHHTMGTTAHHLILAHCQHGSNRSSVSSSTAASALSTNYCGAHVYASADVALFHLCSCDVQLMWHCCNCVVRCSADVALFQLLFS